MASQEEKGRAHALVKDRLEKGGVGGLWPHLRADWVTYEVHQRIDNPELISQGHTNTCGIAAPMFFWARDNPLAYATLVTDLYTTGEGMFGSNKIKASSELRSDPPPISYKNGQVSTFTPHADWVLLGSVRQSFNTWMEYRSPNAGWWADLLEPLRAINLPSDVIKGLHSAGYNKVRDCTAWSSGKGIDNALAAGTEAAIGHRVVLLIHGNMLKTEKQCTRGTSFLFWHSSDHWIGLLDDIVLSVDQKRVLPFHVFSWGQILTVPRNTATTPGGLPVEAFIDNYYGYVTAWY
jgi:hypothetical protein